MNTKYQASTDIEKEGLLKEYEENLPSRSSTEKKMSENAVYCSTWTVASERRKAVGVFLELLMHVICIQLNVRVTELRFIPLGETFTLAV